MANEDEELAGACGCGCDHEHGHEREHGYGHEDGRDHDHCHDHGHSHCCDGDDCCHDDHCCNDDDHCHDGDDCCHDDHCCCGHDHAGMQDAHELSAPASMSLHVLGVDCPSCAMACQNAVRLLESVDDAKLTYATATLEVVKAPCASNDDCLREVLACVRSCGQDLELSQEELERLEAGRSWWQEHREQLLMGVSGVALAIGLVIDHLMGNEAAAIPAYVIAAVAGLVFVAPMALAALRRRTADMNVLMGIAVLGGLVMGFAGDTSVFGDAAIVIFLDQVGEWLEGWSMRRTTGSIKELMELAPDVAHVLGPDGQVTDEEVARVEEGERIRVLPGERVPLDGVILQGSSSFNEAAITGESVPRDRGVGDEVFAGSLNVQGVVDLEVTADEDCTTLARVIAMVQGAQAEKAPYEGFVDRFAAAYTPVVIVGALVVGIAVPLVISLVSGFSGAVWHDWVYRALSLLVVACPCALVISTPVSFVSALTRAARMGVLVKGGAHFDVGSRVTCVTLDKTGTLTTGAPQVTGVAALGGATEDGVLALAAALEAGSTHPLGRAIVARAAELGLETVGITGVEEVAANGMRGMVGDVACAVGKPSFALGEGVLQDEVARAIEQLGGAGATTLVVSYGGRAVGVIGVADALRPTTRQSMAELLRSGSVRSLEMLTGDAQQVAAAVATDAGVTSFRAGLLPAQKVARVRELQGAGEVVAMVGDGINDAPALATADLGITMGAAASDTALEVADVALLGDDLAQLPAFFRLAVRTMHVVRENIAFAIGVKVLVFLLVVAGVAGMGAAVFADTGVALIVILNGMRLMLDSRLSW